MRKFFLLAVVFLGMVFSADARSAEAVSIAVVDVQLILNESSAGKNIQTQLEAHKTKFLSEISQQEQKLREDEKTLSGQRTSLAAEEFAKKAREFEEKLTGTRRQAQERKKALEDAANKALARLRDEIYSVVQGISSEKGYSLVLSRQSVVLSSKDLDITPAVLEKLNKTVSEIPIEINDK